MFPDAPGCKVEKLPPRQPEYGVTMLLPNAEGTLTIEGTVEQEHVEAFVHALHCTAQQLITKAGLGGQLIWHKEDPKS